MERERERGRERGEGTLMFERRTRYLSAAWWVVDPRMARSGEQGMALGREGEIGREGGRERERERERPRLLPLRTAWTRSGGRSVYGETW